MSWLDSQMALLTASTTVVELALDWLLQSTLLIASGLLAGRLLERRGSAAQSAVYRTTLATVLLCPIASLALWLAGVSGWSVALPKPWTLDVATIEATPTLLAVPERFEPVPARPVEPVTTARQVDATFESDQLASQALPPRQFPPQETTGAAVAGIFPAPTSVEPAPMESTQPAETTLELSVHISGWTALAICALWFLVCGARIGRLATAWWQLSRLCRRAVPADNWTQQTCRELSALFGVRAPQVLRTPYLPSPCLAGVRRAVILLPDIDVGLSMRDVLAHELAHLVRRDCHWNLLRQLALAIFFFQPLLWMLSRRLESAAEEVCDDYVVQFGGDRQQYAHRLVDIAELCTAPIAAAGVGIVSLRSMLARRVYRIMDTSRSLSTRVGSMLMFVVLVAGLVGTLIAGLVGIGPSNSIAQVAGVEKTDETSDLDRQNGDDDLKESDSKQLPKADAAKAVDQTDSAPAGKIVVHGRVLDLAGRPIGGAPIQVTRSRWRDVRWESAEHQILGETTTDSEGAFRTTIPYSPLDERARQSRFAFLNWRPFNVVASAPGYSLDWISEGDDPVDREFELRLDKNSPAIHGRLISLEGTPISGARLKIKTMWQAEPGAVDKWLEDVARFRSAGLLPLKESPNAFVSDDDVQKMFFPIHNALMLDHPQLPPPTITGADGRFEVTGLGSDRLLELEVSGPGIVKQLISVITRQLPSVEARQIGDPGYRNNVYYGADFDHVVEAAQPIVGVVKDAESGSPLKGVIVTATKGAGYQWTAEGLHSVATDADGRFRMEGMPAGEGNELKVIPNDSQPYLMTDHVPVPERSGIQPVEVEIRLRRGVFVRGRVYERESGKPVDATIHYHPLKSNKNAPGYLQFGKDRGSFDTERDRYRTKPDGSFQIVAIPGRGILGVLTVDGDYSVGLGAGDIEGLDQLGRFPTYGHCSPRAYNQLAEIDVNGDATLVERDLPVSVGGNARCELVDADGKPLATVRVANRVPKHGHFGSPTTSNVVVVAGLSEGETRQVAFWHEQRNLGCVVPVRASDSTQRIVLQPCPVVSGRVLDGADPVAGGKVRGDLSPSGDFTLRIDCGATDNDGRFQFNKLLPGGNYSIFVDRPNSKLEKLSKLENVQPGVSIDLGQIDISDAKRPGVTAVITMPKANSTSNASQQLSANAADLAGKAAATPDKTITVHGRVLGEDGKPVSGATVHAAWMLTRRVQYPSTHYEYKIVDEDKSDDDGNFELTFSTDHPDPPRLSLGWHVVAFADGRAPAWQTDEQIRKNLADKQPTTLTLSGEHSVRGRVVDLEGKPVSGARVRVHTLRRPENDEALRNWLQEAKAKSPPANVDDYYKNDFNSPPTKSPYAGAYPALWRDRFLQHGSPALPADTSTDENGQFQLSGLARDQLVILEFASPQIAKCYAHVVVSDMAPVSAKPFESMGVRSGTYFGKEFQFVAEPTQPISGKVVDAETGQPLANREVRIDQFAGNLLSQQDFLTTHTDAEGRYTLVGAPAGGGHDIEVSPNSDEPYFPTEKKLAKAAGVDPVQLDFALRRGQWIVGTVTDEQSGEPIKQASVEYLPLRDNESAKDYPNYRPEITGSVPSERYRSSDDGSFRVLAIPGPGILAVIAGNEDRKRYAFLTRDLAPQHLLKANGELNAYHPWNVTGYHALREVQLEKSADDTTVDVYLTKGLTRAVKLVDSQGQAVKRAQVLGRNAPPSLEGPLDESTVNLIGLRPNETREVVFIQADRRIGKAVTVSAGDEMTVELEPCAVARGRVIDKDGEPVAELPINVTADDSSHWHRPLVGTTTDKDGRFEALLPPGTTCRVWHYSKKGADFSAECQAQAGEVFELGDLADKTKLDTAQTDKLRVRKSDDRQLTSAAVEHGPRADEKKTPTNPKNETRSDERFEFAGKVVDPTGKPLAGAELFLLFYVPTVEGRLQPSAKPLATTDATGSFQFTSSPADFGGHATSQEFGYAALVARKDGFGFAWTQAGKFETSGSWLREARAKLSESPAWYLDELKTVLDSVGEPLKVVDDNEPIRGRVVDINGQPVAGARLTVVDVISATDNNLTAWRLAAKQANADYYSTRTKTPRSIGGQRVSLFAPAVTGADGRFVLRGVGQGRIAELLVEGLSIETVKIFARTEAGERIELLQERSNPTFGTYVYHPSEFVYVAGPSAPIVGEVRNANSKLPLVGVTIKSQQRHGNRISGWGQDFVRTLTDEQGRYRLEGMPIGKDNRIAAVAPDGEVPYLAMSQDAPTASPDRPLMLDFNLQSGVWVEGRITDNSSGKGLPGSLTYYLTNDNPRFDEARWLNVDLRDLMRADREGHFRVAVLPGAGLIGFMANDHEHYPRADSILKLDGTFKKTAESLIRARPSYVHVQNYHVLAEINPPADSKSITLDIQLDPGQSASGRVVDREGKTVTNYRYCGHMAQFDSWRNSTGDKFELQGYDPSTPRPVYFAQTERNLVGRMVLQGPLPADLVVKLESGGKVTGRLIDSDGAPMSNCELVPWSPPLSDPGKRQPYRPAPLPPNVNHSSVGRYETDNMGRFEFACLVPGVEYRVRVFDRANSMRNSGAIDATIKVAPGESKDLGDVKMADDKKVMAELNLSSQAAMTRSQSSQKAFIGHIRRPDGQPAAGAHVAVVAMRTQPHRGGDLSRGGDVLAEGTAAASGAYRLALMGVSSKTHRHATLLTRMNGYGVAWKTLDLDAKTSDIPLTLATEELIRGRLVDIEGRPAGNVRLSISSIMKTQTDDEPTRDAVGFSGELIPQAWLQPLTSDEHGRFTLQGIPAGYGTFLMVEGDDRFAPQDIAVNTGMAEQRGQRDGTYRPLVVNSKPGEEAVLPLSPAQLIEGTVTYQDTGKPAAHARLTIWASQQEPYGSMVSVAGKADENGHYRISPRPGIRFGVNAYPADGVPYLARETGSSDGVRWNAGDRVKQVDLDLRRGVLVRGAVVEAETGQPVAGASVQYHPEDVHNSNVSDDILTGWQGIELSDDRGKFQIVVLPGPGRLLVHSPHGRHVMHETSERELSRSTPGGRRYYANAIQRVDPAVGSEPIELNISLQPSATIAGKLEDEQKQSVDKVRVISRLFIMPHSPFWRGYGGEVPQPTAGNTFEVSGLAPDQECPVYFLNAERRLGATAVLRSGMPEPTIMLKPCGQATARFIDSEGQPRAGFNPALYFVATPGTSTYDSDADKSGKLSADEDFAANVDRLNFHPWPVTDEQGRVTLPALIPGATYRLYGRQNGKSRLLKEFTLSASEQRDLGDIVVEVEK